MTVNITETDTFGVVTRQYFYFEGANITNNKTFTYDEPGVYEIIQVVGVDNIDDKSDTLRVEVLESRRPDIQVSKCSGRQVAVTSLDTFYDSIRVYFGGPDSVTLLTNEVATYVFPSEGTQTFGLKGFFDNADEVCLTFFEETIPENSLPVPAITSASVKETCEDVYALYLRLEDVDSLVNYRVYIDQGNPITLFNGYLDRSLLVLGDIPFTVSEYCVRIEAFDVCNGTSAQSDEICLEPSTLSLSPFETLYSTYTDSSVYINLDPVQSGSFEITRRVEGADFEPRTNVNGSFHDLIGTSTRHFFYRIDYIDSCGTNLYSAETHPPLIDAELISDNRYLVSFTTAENSLESTSSSFYEVGNFGSFSSESVNSSPFEIRLNSKDGSPRQHLTVNSNYSSGEILRSNAVSLKYEFVVYVPTAFTPNGDGLNDDLEFFGLPTENALVKIYNRYGQLIFFTDDASIGWDGMVAGSLAPAGTYLYEITFETSTGEKLTQRGTFVLIIK